MKYELHDIIQTKKNHVCGSNQWEVTRIGAEIKIKCLGCGREIIILKSLLDKKVVQKIEKL
jgi:hypothetical protein